MPTASSSRSTCRARQLLARHNVPARRAGYGLLPAAGHGAPEAAHAAPRPRRAVALRGTGGGGGVRFRLRAALPPADPVRTDRGARMGAAGSADVGERPAAAPP